LHILRAEMFENFGCRFFTEREQEYGGIPHTIGR
jgi:hypothetical protein